VTDTTFGLIFAMPLLLAVFSPLVVTYLSKIFENRLIISIALVCIAFSFMLIGPSKVLGIEPNLTIMCVGLVLMGFFAGTALIPLYPDLLEYSNAEFGDCK
jgi:MFS family permease